MIYLAIGVVAVVAIFAALWLRADRDRRLLDRHSINPEDLYVLMSARKEVLLFDIRQPLDILADAEMIPGARRIPPKEIEENASLVPRDKDVFVYCTCPSDRTSREITRRALAMNFLRIKFLRGGIAAWKQKGYPVEPFRETFRLDTAT